LLNHSHDHMSFWLPIAGVTKLLDYKMYWY